MMMNSGRGLFWGHDMGRSGRFVSMTKHDCILTTIHSVAEYKATSSPIQYKSLIMIIHFIIAHRLVDTRVDKRERRGSRARAVGANLMGSIFVILRHHHQAHWQETLDQFHGR